MVISMLYMSPRLYLCPVSQLSPVDEDVDPRGGGYGQGHEPSADPSRQPLL